MGYIKRTLFIFCLVVFLMLPSIAFCGEVLNIATGEWAPYVSEAEGGSGICADIVRAAFAAEGIKAEFCFYPWKRALRSLELAGVDGSFPWVKRDEREQLFLYSDSIYEMKTSLFFLKKRFKEPVVFSSKAMSKYMVGVPLGYELGNDLKQMGFKCEPVSCIKNGFEMLLKERIDFLLESDDVGRHMIKKTYPEQISDFGEIVTSLKTESLYLLFCKKKKNSKYFLSRFNKGLRKIKADGIYAKLVDSY